MMSPCRLNVGCLVNVSKIRFVTIFSSLIYQDTQQGGLSVNSCFGGKYCLHPQAQISEENIKQQYYILASCCTVLFNNF
jgi:hypothetical protein